MSKVIIYNKGLVKLILSLPIGRSVTIISGTIYLCGYIINTVFLRSIGVDTNALVKSEFVETGLMFAFLTSALMIIPISSYFSLRDIRKEMNLDSSFRMLSTLSFILCNFCFTLIFFALFIKGDDFHSLVFSWKATAMPEIFISTIFAAYLFVIILGLMFFFHLEEKSNSSAVKKFNCCAFIAYVVFAILSVGFDYMIIVEIPWVWEGIKNSMFYLFLVIAMGIILYWVNARSCEFKTPEGFRGLGILSGITLLTLFYLAMTAYIFTTYKNIPMSRGGKLPDVRVKLIITREEALPYPDIIQSKQKETIITKPLYLIEQNNDYLFFITKYHPFKSVSSYGKVYAIKRKNVISMSCKKYNVRKHKEASL